MKIKGYETIITSYDVGIKSLDLFNEGDVIKLIPSMLNLCFAIEIAIKSILSSYNIEFKRTHDLETLFKQLPIREQDDLINYVLTTAIELNIPMLKTRGDFFRDLNDNSDLYVKLRYFSLEEKEITFKANFIVTIADYLILKINKLKNLKLSSKSFIDEFELNIKKVRIKKNVTIDSLAKKLKIHSYILNKFENNEKIPSLEMLLKISSVLNCKIDDLIIIKNKGQ